MIIRYGVIEINLDKYRDLLSVSDLMEIFNVSKTTIYKEIKEGKFGSPIQIGRAFKIPRMYIWNKFFNYQPKNENINKENIDDIQKIQNNFTSIVNESPIKLLEDETNSVDTNLDEITMITQTSSQIEWSEKTAAKDKYYLEHGYVKELNDIEKKEDIHNIFSPYQFVNPHKPNRRTQSMLMSLINPNKCNGFSDYKGFYGCYENEKYEVDYIYWKCSSCPNGMKRKEMMDNRRLSFRMKHKAKTENSRSYTNGYIYFIKSDSVIKIGKSKKPQDRINAIKTGNINIEFLFAIKTSEMNFLEKHLHNKYRNNNVSREWFNLSKEDLFEIKRKYSKSLIENLSDCC